ncbi:Tight junction protein ZO-1 [Eumeta japonica]|uniref:Netrin receptor UNC5 n=1 Tax=Eumeta variegata TaxID=151549 RepID=A0A4C1XAN6_EUMVA|nr:Tight junction protein ZO-1 [Eumeta japonica]
MCLIAIIHCVLSPHSINPPIRPPLDYTTLYRRQTNATVNANVTSLSTVKWRGLVTQTGGTNAQRPEPLSDDFLFSMSSSTENRLSYASSPESDLEISPPPAPRLVKSSSDPSIATTQDNMDRDDDLNHIADAVPPPYTQGGYGDSKYGFSSSTNGANHHNSQSALGAGGGGGGGGGAGDVPPYTRSPMRSSPPHSPLYGTVPELPPRTGGRPTGGVLLPAPPPGRPSHSLRHNPNNHNRPSAQERLFGPPKDNEDNTYTARPNSMIITSSTPGQNSLDRHRHTTNASSYDGTPPYDYMSGGAPGAGAPANSGSGSLTNCNRLGPNAPDDLKVAPPGKYEPPPPPNPSAMATQPVSPQRHSQHEHSSLEYRTQDNTYRSSETYRNPGGNRPPPPVNGAPGTNHARGPSLPNVGGGDYSKYSSRTNSASQADYATRGAGGAGGANAGGNGGVPPYKPVPPPKPKHYRPPDPMQHQHQRNASLEPPPPTNPAAGQRLAPSNGFASYYGGGFQHSHSHSQPTNHYPPQQQYPPQQSMYGGGQMAPQSPPYSGPPSHPRALNLPHNPHIIDLAGSREQRGSAFELYRKPQHMHNISSPDAMNSNVEHDETISPKTKKKLSKKPSFIKNAVLDLFRSRSKSSQKVSRQKSFCESDLQQRNQSGCNQSALRREKSDLSEMSVHMRNTQIRNQMLQRSNSSCEKSALKPILKRQNSFGDERGANAGVIRDYEVRPVMRNLRRQNSMVEMETEPKVTPLLRRQNSLIEYNRRGIYGHTQSFNLITKIDPIYQRTQVKHEPFYPTQPLPPEPLYQSKQHVYDPVPKPKRTYASIYGHVGENAYATRSEISDQSFNASYGNSQNLSSASIESPYGTRSEYYREKSYGIRNDFIMENLYGARNEIQRENPYGERSECIRESPYGIRNEIVRETPYATKNELLRECTYGNRSEIIRESPYVTKHQILKQSDPPYAESPYSTKDQIIRQKLAAENPYATKEEMLRQRFSESPYSAKHETGKHRLEGTYPGKKTYEPPSPSWSENPYGIRPDRRLYTPINFPCRTSSVTKSISEPPYATTSEMMARLIQTESPYATRNEVKSSCSDRPFSDRQEVIEVRPASTECTYVSKQEILSQKAALLAGRESAYDMKLEEKLEIIKQRNQAKKDLIYQSRKEANEADTMKTREPIYVSKRDLKDSVIYESQLETKENPQIVPQEDNERNSPYELSDANHLSRREPIYQTKKEAQGTIPTDTFQEIDFSALRLPESQTDSEKENNMKLVLKGEPVYASRLQNKADNIPNPLRTTASPVPYESSTSMETQYISECSINFENKPQSTPYTSQDFDEKASKSNRTVTFCERILEKSPESSQDNTDSMTASHNETTVVDNQNTTVEANAMNENIERNNTVAVEPEGPHTTWGIFDSDGGILEDRQWGVSLIIPPKAIAPGIKQKIYFTVTDPRLSQRVGGPPIDMDNGEAMLSPLVMCGPQGLVFLRPVTLRLPHCANAVPSLGLTIKATDTEAHLSTDWDHIHLPTTTTLNTVAVKVDHF